MAVWNASIAVHAEQDGPRTAYCGETGCVRERPWSVPGMSSAPMYHCTHAARQQRPAGEQRDGTHALCEDDSEDEESDEAASCEPPVACVGSGAVEQLLVAALEQLVLRERARRVFGVHHRSVEFVNATCQARPAAFEFILSPSSRASIAIRYRLAFQPFLLLHATHRPARTTSSASTPSSGFHQGAPVRTTPDASLRMSTRCTTHPCMSFRQRALSQRHVQDTQQHSHRAPLTEAPPETVCPRGDHPNSQLPIHYGARVQAVAWIRSTRPFVGRAHPSPKGWMAPKGTSCMILKQRDSETAE